MKRSLSLFLLLLYLLSGVGIRAEAHYCMGHLVRVALCDAIKKESCQEPIRCENCGMEENTDNGCCKHIYEQLKIDTNQLCVGNDDFALAFTYIILPYNAFYTAESPVYPYASSDYSVGEVPPDKHIPLYLFCSVFLI